MCESVWEVHAPYVGCAVGRAALGNEVDVLAVATPYRAEVVGCVISQLHHVGAVGVAGKDVGVGIALIAVHQHIAAHEEYPVVERRKAGSRKAANGVAGYTLFDTGLIVDTPYFSTAFSVEAGAEQAVLVIQRSGFSPLV